VGHLLFSLGNVYVRGHLADTEMRSAGAAAAGAYFRDGGRGGDILGLEAPEAAERLVARLGSAEVNSGSAVSRFFHAGDIERWAT
jgi:hypothetical protein